MRIQLSLSLRFCLILNSCNGNDAFRSDVTLSSWNSPAHSAVNTGFYHPRPVSAKQSGWPGNPVDSVYSIWRLTQQCVYEYETYPRHQRLDRAHHWHMGEHITKHRSSWSIDKAVVCTREGKETSLWTSAKLKPALFRVDTLHNRHFSEPPIVYRGKHVVSRPFHHSYLKANKISKSEGMRKVEYAYHFGKCADVAYQKLSKSVYACRNYSLPKLARF